MDGCGLLYRMRLVCVEVCPTRAITLVDGKACVDVKLCVGCEAFVDACSEGERCE